MSPAPEAAAPPPADRPRGPRALAARIVREPLTHFLVIGAVLFLALTVVKDARRPVLRLDAEDLNQLIAYWEMQTERPPTKDELDGIIRERVDEEILAREAVRLGLDRDDMIIRRRLAQKMAFAGEDTDAVPEPSEAELRAFYDTTKARYAAPAAVSLRHVFFSADRPAGDPAEAAELALQRANRGETPTGDPFVLPLAYADARLIDLSRDYGPDFAQAVADAPVGRWSGPVRSAYGWHLVRVEARRASEIQPFEAVRPEVRDAWIADKRKAANAAFMERLRGKYRVVVAQKP